MHQRPVSGMPVRELAVSELNVYDLGSGLGPM